jgi:cytochrome c oxidase subunit 4
MARANSYSAEPTTAHGAHPTVWVYLAVYAALLVLLVVTVAIAQVELGAWNFKAAITVATIKALLILLFFMQVRYSPPLIWMVAGAAFFWLGILLSLTLSDYWTRQESPYSEMQQDPVVCKQIIHAGLIARSN